MNHPLSGGRTRLAVLGHTLLLAGAAARPDLSNNGPFVTNPGGGAGGAGVSVVQESLGFQVSGFLCQGTPGQTRLADDFTVTGPAGWTVSEFVFYGFQTGSGTAPPTINSINVRVWSGRPGDAGSTVLFGNTTINRFLGAVWASSYRAPESDITNATRPIFAVSASVSPPLTLAPGTYWVDWQAGGTLSSGPWAVPVTILGQTGAPGANARTYNGSSGQWTNLRDTGNSAQQDLAFVIRGTIGGGGPAPCYPNCDASTAMPCLNVNDFGCFLNRFAAGDSRANCDASTTPPILNVNDFGCFLNQFAAGCSAC